MAPVNGKPTAPGMAGFSLIELLIVFTLLVTLSAILAPLLLPSPARTLQSAAGEMATGLRETRRKAQANQSRERFLIDTDKGEFGVESSDARRELPDDVAVALTTGRSLITGESRGGIDFFPDGSSTGGRIDLSIAERAFRIDVEWLTGRIRVTDELP